MSGSVSLSVSISVPVSAHLVQLLHDLLLVLVVRNLEPLVKGLCGAENLGQQEVEQRPQLVQVVLGEADIRSQQPVDLFCRKCECNAQESRERALKGQPIAARTERENVNPNFCRGRQESNYVTESLFLQECSLLLNFVADVSPSRLSLRDSHLLSPR